MLIKRLHSIGSIMVLLFVVVAGFSALSLQKPNVQAEGFNACPTTLSIVKGPSPYTISGLATLKASIPSTYQASDVLFLINDDPLTQAMPISTTQWQAEWDSLSLPDGNYGLSALVSSTSTTILEPCKITPVDVAIANNTNTSGSSITLAISVLPGISWVGPVNTSVNFSAKLFVTDSTGETIDKSADAYFVWSTTRGQITPSHRFAGYFSGPTAGTGQIKVEAFYGGKQKSKTISVTVESSSTVYPGGSGTSSDDSTKTTTTTIATSTDDSSTDSGSSDTQPGDPVLENCIEDKLGKDVYEDVIKEGKRLTLVQLKLIYECLSANSYLLPSNLAPVNPTEITKLKEARKEKNLKISGIESASGTEGSALKFNGTSEPDSQVLLYVFSEPLVLTTVADANGNWSYVLENPLKPGDHEAYVVVEDDNGEYVRSSSFGFAVAQVPTSPSNPDGLSLSLEQTDQAVYEYAAVGGFFIIVAMLLLFAINRNHRKVQAAATQFAEAPSPTEEVVVEPPVENVISDAPSTDPVATTETKQTSEPEKTVTQEDIAPATDDHDEPMAGDSGNTV